MSGKQSKKQRRLEKAALNMSVREVLAGVVQITRRYYAKQVTAEGFNQAMNGAEIFLLKKEVDVAFDKMDSVVKVMEEKQKKAKNDETKKAYQSVITELKRAILEATAIN